MNLQNSARHRRVPNLMGSLTVVLLAQMPALSAAPTVTRLTPPSELFASNEAAPPYIARFVAGQRFDLQATIVPDPGQQITKVAFTLDGGPIDGRVTLVSTGLAEGVPAAATVASLRAFALDQAGVHTFDVVATQSDGAVNQPRPGNFEVVALTSGTHPVRNIILLLGDGMGAAHRTAARIVQSGYAQGKARSPLAMDTFPVTAMIETASLNSIVTDSAPGMQNYVTGNKAANNQEGVWPDDTAAPFDNPRVEYLSEYLHRTRGTTLGVVTTADVFDATPASMAVHTAARGAGTGIVDQFFDDRATTGLTVLLGGGRQWFLPQPTPCPDARHCPTPGQFKGSARAGASDYVLPASLASGWHVAPGALDPERNLIDAFVHAGWRYAPDAKSLLAASPKQPLLGLFALSNMNVAFDKLNGRRGHPEVVKDFGFPDQPLLEEMTQKALEVLDAQSPHGFVLLVEGASIDKQAHMMDSERWIMDTIEFDHAVAVAKHYAERHSDTLVVVTADHETGGTSIIGAARVSAAELGQRADSGAGTAVGGPRNGVVGTYEAARFPRYLRAADGYPASMDPDHKMLIGYGANADRHEDWISNARPLQDPHQPGGAVPPLNSYPATAAVRDNKGGYLIVGQVEDAIAAHTGTDVPLSAFGRGATLFGGTMDNTDVFFRLVRAANGDLDN